MTSVVDKYYRRIIQNIDNVRMKFDISSLLVKTKENDSKINTNESDISNNTSLIDTILSNISSNLSKINTNKKKSENNKTLINANARNVSANLSKINTNKKKSENNTTLINANARNVSANLSKINTNKKKSENNTTLINANARNVSNNFNFTQINKKKSDNNTTFIDTNRNNIASNLLLINEINNYYKLKDIFIIDIIKSNIPETIDINNNEFIIINSSLDNLKKDSYLQFDSSILIFFHKHYINIAFFHILLEYLDDKNVLIESIKMPIIGMVSKHANITNSCIFKIPNELDIIYYKFSIKLNDCQNRSDSISILDFYNNIYFKYFEK